MKEEIVRIGKQARRAALGLSALSGEDRGRAISAMSGKLLEVKSALLEANRRDVGEASRSGLAGPLVKRLEISDKVFRYMQDRLGEVSLLPDPVGRVLEGHVRPNGLKVEKISVPLGVIGVLYESRPNVTTDAASVCLKAGNAVILRGGSESLSTNIVLADAMIAVCRENGVPEHAVQIIRTPGHESVSELLKLDRYIDVLIPRGGKPLIRAVSEGTRIPVIKHYEGLCHLYLAADAPEDMAVAVAVNSKCQKVEVCNALEKLLIDAACAERLLPALVRAFDAQDVELRGCPDTRARVPSMKPATEEDWVTEYLAPILTVKIVDGLREAVDHINTFGSGHTDGIVTQDIEVAARFVRSVDSASVMVNASTRLSGGGDYGMGAVVGISTDKLHARGPVGPNDLTSYKWVATGSGHLRD
ncbi:MAG TPA: glutamate-5-semialdehyde dehydrogenase [bacterium]|nr:glutamate-5-semialdehyde dehydrogenase [bacterium]